MDSIFTKPVTKKRLILYNRKTALALSDPVRAEILIALAHRTMNAEELTQSLKPLGMQKATSTIRHHLDLLKSSGLVEVSRMDESRGAVTKYYSPVVKVFQDHGTEINDPQNAKLVDDTCRKLAKLLATISKNITLREPKGGNPACSHCGSGHSREVSVIRLLDHCILKVIEDEAFQRSVASPSVQERETRTTKQKGPSGA